MTTATMTKERRIELELGALMRQVTDTARLLPALAAENGKEERERLVRALSRGEMITPDYALAKRRVPSDVWSALELSRRLAEHHPAGDLYLARLEELELELGMIEALGDARRIRPLSVRRYGTGQTPVPFDDGMVPLARVAASMLATEVAEREEHLLPADGLLGTPSMAELVRRVAAHTGIEVSVRVEPRMVSSAATGERVVFLADRLFGAREALRLAVHEVLGHLVAAANARAQPMRLLEFGCAGSFADQEGLALWLEDAAGFMDGLRRRTIAARVVAADRMHAGASFGETARDLVRDYDFLPQEAVVLAERAYRGGGVARDVCYLRGWLRVRLALAHGDVTVDELRAGRVAVDAVPRLRELTAQGLVREAVYRPSLAYSLASTDGGTSPSILPPSWATSFTMLELT